MYINLFAFVLSLLDPWIGILYYNFFLVKFAFHFFLTYLPLKMSNEFSYNIDPFWKKNISCKMSSGSKTE